MTLLKRGVEKFGYIERKYEYGSSQIYFIGIVIYISCFHGNLLVVSDCRSVWVSEF